MTRTADRTAAHLPLGSLTWPEVAASAAESILIVPLGSTEQHGPHLPLGTDSAITVALAGRLAAARPDILVAPLLPYGSAGEHAAFPGTLSIGAAALELIVVELVRSADAFAGVVLVSGHGGNAAPLAAAVATLRREGRRVLAWTPRVRGGERPRRPDRDGAAAGPVVRRRPARGGRTGRDRTARRPHG